MNDSTKVNTVARVGFDGAKDRDHAMESKLIAEARADVVAGRTISLEAIEAWVRRWETDQELPPPQPGN